MRDRIDGHASTGRDRLRELDPAHLWIIGVTRPRDSAARAGFGRTRRLGASELSAARFIAPGPGTPGPGPRLPDVRAPGEGHDDGYTGAAVLSGSPTFDCECPSDCLIDHELD